MYEEAFKRNIGWVTEWEQQQLRGKRVAIAGMGGVGGAHLLTLARLGIGSFHIADFDRFELANFNRQTGAFVSTLQQDKATVMATMARDINPEMDLRLFPEGVTEQNLEAFLEDVDLFVDGFDAFVLDARAKVFARCAELGIPAITAAPIGMGTAFLTFLPGHMTFEQYFRLEGHAWEEQIIRFVAGLAPKGLHRAYIVEASRLNLSEKRAPSLSASCMLCAGVVGNEAVKLLLKRGKIYPAPYYHHLDVYREKYLRGYLRYGNRHPLQRLKLYVACNISKRQAGNARPDEHPPYATAMERILDAARWAPSGDNTQFWRFEILSETGLVLHISSPGEIMYIREKEAFWLSTGMLLEAIEIAARQEGYRMQWRFQPDEGIGRYHIEVLFHAGTDTIADPLHPYLRLRHTNRQHYRTTPLTDQQKAALEAALGGQLSVTWRCGFAERWQTAKVNMQAFFIRMSCRTAYEQLAGQLDWQDPFPRAGIPIATLPITAPSRWIMRWAMKSWRRLGTLAKIPGALLPSAIETELLPALCCGGHFILTRSRKLPVEAAPDTLIAEGRALLRFWLTLTRLGLTMQPSYSPIVFSHYGHFPEELPADERFLASRGVWLGAKLAALAGTDTEHIVFMGRLGTPKSTAVTSRSLRKPLEQLLMP